MQTQPIIVNNTRGPITIVSRKAYSDKPGPAELGHGMGGRVEFAVSTVTLKPGTNALSREQMEIVAEQRDRNPIVKARFERLVTAGRGNAGHPELAEQGKLDRYHLEQMARQCSDPATLRKLRDHFATDKALGEIIEDQLAKTTVTADGTPIAHDVKRDPSDPRKGAR